MNHAIYPCLWFDTQAREAVDWYCSLFPRSEIRSADPTVMTFTLNGTQLMALNGGPQYPQNETISLFAYCGGDTAEIDRLYAALTEGGSVLMPLDRYDWSPRYAWVTDRFGVNWQLDVEPIRSDQKIVPTLLFTNEKKGQVKAALTQYSGLFPASRLLMEAPYPASAEVLPGSLLFAQCKLNDFILNAMSSTQSHDHDFSPAVSFVVPCETQAEIDRYWQALSEGGQEGRCGWLTDRFGVSWQIIPKILTELMADPDRAPRVRAAYLGMQKLDLNTLLTA